MPMSSNSQQFLGIGCVAAGLCCMALGSCIMTATTTPSDSAAIDAVRSHQRQHGGDPAREEITATWDGCQWQVISWHIIHPGNRSGSRFVPGGFTSYTVSSGNEVVDVRPGR